MLYLLWNHARNHRNRTFGNYTFLKLGPILFWQEASTRRANNYNPCLSAKVPSNSQIMKADKTQQKKKTSPNVSKRVKLNYLLIHRNEVI